MQYIIGASAVLHHIVQIVQFCCLGWSFSSTNHLNAAPFPVVQVSTNLLSSKPSLIPTFNHQTHPHEKLLIFLLLLQTTAFAQRKLKYDIIKESGDTVFYTNEEKLYTSAGDTYGTGRNKRTTVGDYLKSTVLKYPTGFALEFSIQTGSTNSFSIYTGQTAKLLLSDGSVISLPCRNNYSSKKSSMGYGCWLFAFYSLSSAAIEKLKAGTVSSIRIETSMGSFDYPLKEKAGGIIAEQLNKF